MNEEKTTQNCYDESGPEVRKQYHPALCNAMELELFYDRELLEFQQEVTLNTLPREIDFLVIRKEKPGEIGSELGKIFLRCNIWEFKGFGDSLGISAYYKTLSYAYEYLSIHSDINGIEDVTLSFVREGWPSDLLKWLDDNSYIRQPGPEWLERFHKRGYPDMQVVNIAHEDAPVLLHALSHKAEPADIKKSYEYITKLPDEERRKARLIMELSYNINGDERGGTEMGGFFETFVDPLEETIRKQNEELKQKEAELKQNRTELEQKDDELEKSRIRIAQLEAELAAARE